MTQRFDPAALDDFAAAVLQRVGLPETPARSVADGLVLADLYGHSTHGLALLADYVEEIETGGMATDGEPEVLTDHAAAALWDARRLPGVWTTALAVEAAERKAAAAGLGAIALKRSHHIACLAAFLEAPARRGSVVLVFSSDPSDAFVAPSGGLTPVMTPNPIAAGIPAEPDPILIDISCSITTVSLCGRARREGRRLPGPWLLSADGEPTDDPHAVAGGGAMLPIGGLDHGHKGFGLGLLVEALTQGLGGHGRADAVGDWGASVLVLALSPALFAGSDAFVRQVTWLAEACRAVAPCPTGEARITPGFALKARHVIHAVGPVWHGGAAGEDALLAGAYRSSLELAARHGLRSIAFPAISTGVYGFPLARATRIAVEAARSWAESHAEPGTIVFCVFGAEAEAAYRRDLAD